MERVTSSDENLLQDSHDIGVVKCLRRQSVDDGRYVNFTRSKQSGVLVLNVNLLPRILEQEVNVAREAHFSKNLQLWVTFLDCLIDKNALRIKHLVVDLA